MAPIRDVDFSTLDLCEALDLAILIEEEAQERYQDFADQLNQHHTPEAAAFFHFMAGNEEKHHAALSQKRRQIYGDTKSVVARAQIFDVEAPETGEVRALMSTREAMNTALRAEQRAQRFFAQAIDDVRDRDVRQLLVELCAEEEEHARLVQRELDKLPPDSAFSADDFSDEPTEQD